jgi:hypothetical protein
MLLACRLYYLKTMMFEFHQNTYVERLKVYYFLEYVLDRLASGPLLSVCHVHAAGPGPAACGKYLYYVLVMMRFCCSTTIVHHNGINVGLQGGSTGVELRKSGSEGNTSRPGTDLGRRHVARSAAVQMSMHSVKHLSDWRVRTRDHCR